MRLKFIILSLFIITNLSIGQTFPTDTLVFNGAGENRINLVFLGDGYLEEDQGKYITDVENILVQLFDETPFKEYSKHFNVIAIKVPSNERGAARDPSQLIDNYFGSTYNFSGIDRLLVPTKNDKVSSVLASNFPQFDQAFVLVNDDKYGGSGGWLATSSTNAAAGEIAIHEIGHSLANLSDEYWAGSQYARETANMTKQSNKELVRWKNWVDELDIGIYPHSGDATWFKPHQNCKMQFLGAPFCAVCKETFITVFHNFTSHIDEYTPETQSGLNDPNGFEVMPLTPDPNTLKTWWLLNNDTLSKNSNTVSVSTNRFINGPNELKLTIVDTTLLSRQDQLVAQSITWTLDRTTNPIDISSRIRTFALDRKDLDPDIVTGIEDPFIQEIEFSAFPNPTVDELTVKFNNTTKVNFNMKLVDLNGKVYNTVEDKELLPGNQEFHINTKPLNKGVFLLQLNLGNRLVIHKVLK